MSIHFKSTGDTTGETLNTGRIPQSESKRSVFLATTALWDIDPHFFQCCLKAQQALLVKGLTGKGVINGMFPELYAGESPVGRSRNALTAAFLKSGCSDMLFIDSDLIFSAEQIERIVLHEEDVVGGAYMLKREGFPRMCSNPKPGVITVRDDGLMEVSYIGTGFMRVRRSVFERMIEKFSDQMVYMTDDGRNEIQYDFWGMGVWQYNEDNYKIDPKILASTMALGYSEEKAKFIMRRRWLSEDWWFCQRCQDLNIPVFMDMKCLLGHSGHAVYPLQTQLKDLFPETISADAKQVTVAGAGVSVSPHPGAPAEVLQEAIA